MSGMSVTINGQRVSLAPATTVADVIRERGIPRDGIAVAVDRVVIPRSEWSTTQICDGDRVEIVSAAAGG